MDDFSGFPEAALDFYEGLESDNTKAYWTDHKAVYDCSVQAPMRALLTALEPEFGSMKFFRPYRDVRFSKDKLPYKTHAAAAAEEAGQALYLQVGADGLMIAGGLWRSTTDQARRLRAAIADDRTGKALVKVVTRLTGQGFRVDGDRLQRVPKEHADAPRQELLTLRSLTAVQHHAPEPWLHTPEARDRIVTAWRELGPLNTWLNRHVGPPREPARSAPAG